jgi:hypothetical protein
VSVIPVPRRWAAAAAVVTLGWLATPNAVPIYDGVGQPDEPYRYVTAPQGYQATSPATSGTVQSPVVDGVNSQGMSAQTMERGPQASLFVPPKGLAAAGGPISVTITPLAATSPPAGAVVDGNLYRLSITSPAGPVTLTPQAAIATLYLRSTMSVQPGPVMEYRPDASQDWRALKTSRGGQDIYVSTFPGAGEYALAFTKTAAGKGSSPLPFVLIGGGVLLVGIVVVIRVRAKAA